ncbi:MAG: 50S ribosomal protein L5 [Nanoarchaeota archaeon]
MQTTQVIKENPMRNIRVEKITLNIGTGMPGEKLEKALKLLQKISQSKPVSRKTKKRIPTWGVRPGLEIGAKVTIRGKKAEELLVRLLKARADSLPASKFDITGNLAFGIPEYIEIPGVEYDATIGIIGLEVAVTLMRPGFRIRSRARKRMSIPKKHMITKEEAMEYMKSKFQTRIE